jgi:hypothetical protein
MIKPEVLDVLLEPGLNGMPSLSIEDFTTLTEDAVNVQCFQAKDILDRTKETGGLWF